MGRLLRHIFLFLLLVLPSTINFLNTGGCQNGLAMAEDADPVEGEEEEATVETDDGASEEAGTVETESAVSDKGEEEDDDDEKPLSASPFADTYILFIKPVTSTELPAGKPVRILVGFTNIGKNDFTVDTMEASLRYPQDFSFYIQNFTTVRYNQAIEPKRQASFEYEFIPNEALHARPFGLVLNINYQDAEGNFYQTAVFNETVNIVETDEGLDGETFFLYVFLAAVIVLILVGAQQLLASFGRKTRTVKPRVTVELGTEKNDVDYEWLPKEILQEMNRSPRRGTPKVSPRKRRQNKRFTGAGEE
ncbi:translocon-associated protein subunit alpha [Octopus bimaculoides]|uniref:Translocon-associated protein subunit alpha n=1 Tax=Octopus bimaculoides TaxID=37653 RepID=A0A0L8HF39_OCTBM|nr:translocon-associated protein subunit alpha [Octopus bimaculoides]|eukprot:XP_014773166.1 PREDICTED: translocon-associated protein subunit alpha-like [Octopus bimaculoides]